VCGCACFAYVRGACAQWRPVDFGYRLGSLAAAQHAARRTLPHNEITVDADAWLSRAQTDSARISKCSEVLHSKCTLISLIIAALSVRCRWLADLPAVVDAFFRVAGADEGEAAAQHARFLRLFGLNESECPLLELDRQDWSAPFRAVTII
jgi:hypothetical protein